MNKFVLLLLPILLLFSCTVTKRVYKSGYFVSWHKIVDEKKAIIEELDTVSSLPKRIEASKVERLQSSFHGEGQKEKTNLSSYKEVNRVTSANDSKIEKDSTIKIKQSFFSNDTIPESLTKNQSKQDDKNPIENREKRKFPLGAFLAIILVLLIPFSVFSFALGLIFITLVLDLLSVTLFSGVLGVFLAVIFVIVLFYALFYLFFLLFYSNDPFYENDRLKLKKDFWKISSRVLFLLLLMLGGMTYLLFTIVF